MSIEAQHKDTARTHELAGSVVASPTEVTAAFSVTTPDQAVALAVLGVVVVGVSAVVMLSQGFGPGRLQGVVPALAEPVGDRLAAAA